MQGLEAALRICLGRGLTFVAFRRGGEVHLWVQDRPALEPWNLKDLDAAHDRFVISPFKITDGRVHALRPDRRLLPMDPGIDLGVLDMCEGTTAFRGTAGPDPNAQDHAHAMDAAMASFHRGDLTKVVLARTITVQLRPQLLPELFIRGLEALPHAFVCLINCPEHGTWLGASPERLVQVHDKTLVVDSIAGTMPIEKAPPLAQDWGAKEREEQDLVTQAVTDTMTEQGLHDFVFDGPHVHGAGNVAHLHTELRASLEGASLARFVADLHPTPAVCGTPRPEAMAFIGTHETHERGLYAGFWGPWNTGGSTELHVNIRCMQVFADRANIHVGGGITADSVADDEWQETVYKARLWLDLIAAANAPIS